MKILFAAKDGFKYNRTYILAEGLKALGVEVSYYKIPERRSKYGLELRDFSRKVDAVLVPAFRHRDLAFVRRYVTCPLIFDPLISRYLTKVVDYGQYYKAPQKWWIDYRDFRNCDLLLADTEAHLHYFEKTLRLPTNLPKTVVPVGVHIDEFKPVFPDLEGDLQLGFYGTLVPLQGVLKIVEAFALLKGEKGLDYHLIGTGYQEEAARHLAKSKGLSEDIFKGWVPYDQLAGEVARFDLALGIFGESTKANLVVPNKVYHYAASGKGIITKKSPAIAEVFSDGFDISSLSPEPDLIAEKIIYYRDHREELRQMGQNAYQTIKANYSHRAIAQKLLDALLQL